VDTNFRETVLTITHSSSHLVFQYIFMGTRGPAFLALLLSIAFAAESRARAVMTYIYHAPESSLDVRYLYHWEILRTALERTTPKWGPYRMVQSEFMTERRQAFELKNATGKLTVMYLSTTPDFEKSLVPIRIPVDKNLGGYCVFLIRREEQQWFTLVQSIDDLHRFTYGLGLGWIDVDILRSDGFKVVTGSSYDGLFEMAGQQALRHLSARGHRGARRICAAQESAPHASHRRRHPLLLPRCRCTSGSRRRTKGGVWRRAPRRGCG